MAKPYYLVAYAHVVRISERCNNEDEATRDTFGVHYEPGPRYGSNATLLRMDGSKWASLSQKVRQMHITLLAKLHKKRTGYVISGYEKEVQDVKHKDDCTRVSCTRKHQNCTHKETGKLYCERCAVNINRANNGEIIEIPRLREAQDEWNNPGSD